MKSFQLNKTTSWIITLMVCAFFLLIAFAKSPPGTIKRSKSSHPVDHAIHMCNAIDSTLKQMGYYSQSCDISGWDESITAVIPMSLVEANKLCKSIGPASKGIVTLSGWKFIIKSPSGYTLTSCFF